MKLLVVTVDPVQQIAAEPGTLNRLIEVLRPQIPEHAAAPRQTPNSLTGWPLVADPRLLCGVVYLRPFPKPTGEVSQCDSAS
ncbi:hypothetical protein ACIQRE_01885 [Streptomyces griseoluteus]|uniref:hypothetical protein n=1 Tax=Streptomyces griseoluteus TaxID=29306 RepID=UPI0037F42F80